MLSQSMSASVQRDASPGRLRSLLAGLQAIATARRLGATVEGYDVRPETREQAASLGAKFVDTGVDARGEGGYARELTPEERDRVAGVLTRHI
jgi:NAD(P) transhydrogenase subunit alpha